jgi:DNA segregation ATPase FtsK/SpoIIIE, S-DNA-T family
MNSAELIGQVAALYLRDKLAGETGSSDELGGTSRFILDCLTPEQISAVTRAVLSDSELSRKVEIKLPAHYMEGQSLPAEVLTTERATFYRNADTEKPALLVANTGDDEQQSLKHFDPIGTTQLLDRPELWTSVVSDGAQIPENQLNWWNKALSGLRDLRVHSLDHFAEYVLLTRHIVAEEGESVIVALGAALPALRVLKDSTYFKILNEKTSGHASRYKKLYETAFKKRGCFLLKQTPTQLLLSEDELQATFDKVKESIPDSIHSTVLNFISAPSGWNDEAAALAECEWESVTPLFDGFKREKFNIGEKTMDFFDERGDALLNADELDYLERLKKRKTSGSEEEEDRKFYEDHRTELKDDRKLKSVWDRFVFGKPKESDDFIVGIALCLERLFSQETPDAKRQLTIRCDRATKKDLREDLNANAGVFFATRYQGLRELFGGKVRWEVGQLFKYPELLQEWKNAGKKVNESNSAAALQLTFKLELAVEMSAGKSERYSTQLVWKYDPDTVASQFVKDWTRLKSKPLVRCTANRNPTNTKGQFQSVDLSNVKTFMSAFAKDHGSFVAVYKKSNDIAIEWANNLKTARSQNLVDEHTARNLQELFEKFRTSYSSAIEEFAEEGLAASEIIQQARDYAEMLEAVCRQAKGDRNRELLLLPLLLIGTVAVEGGRTAAVVAPWHPLRLAAVRRKAELVAELVKELLSAKNIDFGDPRLFFKDIEQELAHPFYPEVVLGWQQKQPELLALTDTVGDYTLHEPPLASNDGFDDTNENPTEGANRVVDLVGRYLALHPHEQANLSVVLYNCDSARLPQAVVDKIGSMYSDDDEVRCQIILRHRDAKTLRSLYEKIIESADSDADSYSASEATRDFMSRLRIGIMADQAPIPANDDARPNDMVFSQDVIARHAQLEWYSETAKPEDIQKLIPARWSRRRPAALDDMKSVVYLCCPVQCPEGWAYLTAITTFIKGDWDGDVSSRLLPARQLDFRSTDTARIFEETHNLANWVVNYDELLDRRQLSNQNVRVIRYKQSVTQGRNIIISSKAPLGLLRSMVQSRVRDLNLELEAVDERGLAERFIEDAKEISGDIVLRAAKRGRSASELMGIVLSQFLIRQELGAGRYFGWYFLDDYADWLGQREEQIADILALSPEQPQTPDSKLRLAIIIAESKYIDASGLAAKRKESQKQLRDTVRRINDAIFGNPERLDRELWLARLSDLILDGVKVPAIANINLADWRRAIRDGECEIFVRGYSHVFISGPSDAPDCSDFAAVADVDNSYQEVYGRAQVRDLVLRYHRNQDPMPVRQQLTDEQIWESQVYRQPVERAKPVVVKRKHEEPKSATQTVMPDLPISQYGESVTSDTVTGQINVDPASQPSPNTVTGDSSTASSLTASEQPAAQPPQTLVGTKWSYPAIEPLVHANDSGFAQSESDLLWLKQVESQTKGALQQFQLRSKLISSVLTPNSALLKFAGSADLTVEQVMKRRSEFLTTHGLNIISVRPEAGVVSMAVERPKRQIVKLQDLWKHWHPDSEHGNQELLIAVREDDGNLLFLSPGKDHAPHTLIAGSTGSGKSVLMQNIILGIAATNTPAQAEIVLIDPKQGVDYFQFDGLPHIGDGIIDDQDRALSRLQSLVVEMDARYTKFKNARTNNLAAYNRKVSEPERLPVIWLVHDEFAEWMMVEDYKDAVATLVARLGVKARAAGIYLIFAAQRPDANVMPMQLRSNLGNRLILRVDSEGTSEIALNEKGAERLLGKGHLLANLEGEPLCYAQVPLVGSDFMDEFVKLTEEGTAGH